MEIMLIVKKNRIEYVFYVVNVTTALILGMFTYIIFRPDTYISKYLLGITRLEALSMYMTGKDNIFINSVRYYMCDFLWAYALTFSIQIIIKAKYKKEYIELIIYCLLFEFLVEGMQILNVISGTLDIYDIVFEAVATCIALFFINLVKGESMKKMKSRLFVIGVFAVFMLMAAASGSTGTKEEIAGSKDNSKDNTDTNQTNDSGTNTTEAPDDAKNTGLETIDEAVLFEKEGIRVTAKEIVDDSIWGKGIIVLIENDTTKNVGVQCNTIVVNNYMISDLFSSDVAAGKKDNETIALLSSGLKEAGIDTIAEINISFHVFDSDSYDTLFDTDEISIKTSAYGTVEQPAMDYGKELLNKGGVRIVGKYVTEESIWGAGVLLFIENTSDSDVLVDCDNMSVNGYMVTPYFSSQVNKGRMALAPITIFSTDLEENGIKEVKDLELNFKIINPISYDTIYESKPIPFSVAE